MDSNPEAIKLESSTTTSTAPLNNTPANRRTSTVSSSSTSPTHAVTPGLEWNNIRLTVPVGRGKNKQERVLLQGVTGYANRGEMTAILGPSGAGKTCLTNVLTGRIGGMGKYTLEGHVTFQGKEREEKSWKNTVGYVEQFDLMYDSLTVEETITFSALTRLPAHSYTKVQKIARAKSVIDMLGLSKCRNTQVGSESKRGVSGGERKRTAVGVELVTFPKLLFLDEPTSGLDSHSAFSVVSNVRDISRQGVAVLCTIHQPAYELFKMFDKVILLANGRTAFHGTIPDAIDWFTKLGYPLPEGSNAADHFIALITEPALNSAEYEKEKDRVENILKAWEERGGELQNLGRLKSNAALAPEDGSDRPGFGLGFFEELYWLLRRGYTQQIRDKTTIIASFSQSVFMGIILAFSFYRLGNSQADLLARLGLLFFIPINISFSVFFPIITLLPLINGILIRERRTGSYRISTFYLARLLTEIPTALVTRLIFFVLVYWVCNFQATAKAFFIYLGVNFLTVIYSVCMGLFIGSTSRKLQIVQAITPASNVIFILFAGFLLPTSNIPPWFIWLHWISYGNYVFASLGQNEFLGRKYSCPEGTVGCFPTGEDVIKAYDLGRFSIGANVGLFCLLIAVTTVAGYLMLRRLTRPQLRLKI